MGGGDLSLRVESCSVLRNMNREPKSSIDSIECPSCGQLIPITETLHHQLSEKARAELRQEVAEQQKAVRVKENELKRKEEELRDAEQKVEEQVKSRVVAEKAKVEQAALKKARADVAVELADLVQEATEREGKLKKAQEAELQLRKDKRELEEAKRSFELEMTRTLDSERYKIREAAQSEALEEHRLKDAEKEMKLQAALRINEELRQKLEQGSQQAQGEVLELELEEVLRTNYPLDTIEPISKGVRGADVIQRVHTRAGLLCGSIIWEFKRAKNWSEGWLAKLKDDQREAKADIAVLVTNVLPKGVDEFGLREGVWVASPRLVIGIAAALRGTLSEIAVTKAAAAGKHEAVEVLFNYLTGPEFRQRVEAIVRGFSAMRQDLEEEKRLTARRWAKREKQIDLVINNTSGMYGDLQGLIGGSMQSIPALEAPEEAPEEVVNGKGKEDQEEEGMLPF